jgi:hypothetical protein
MNMWMKEFSAEFIIIFESIKDVQFMAISIRVRVGVWGDFFVHRHRERGLDKQTFTQP